MLNENNAGGSMEIIIGADGGTAPDPVKDGDTAGFAADVIEASNKVPVIVDFWAPWRRRSGAR